MSTKPKAKQEEKNPPKQRGRPPKPKTEKPKKKTGRPKTTIGKRQFEELCKINCTMDEIAGVFNCTDDTVRNWCKETYGVTFSEVYKRFRGNLKVSARRSYAALIKACDKTIVLHAMKHLCGVDDDYQEYDPDEELGQNEESETYTVRFFGYDGTEVKSKYHVEENQEQNGTP